MKKVTSLTLGLSFLVMAATGIILFIVPQGKVAYWTNWTLFGLSKEQYGAVHSTSMVVFLSFGILHIYYNWKPIVSYLKNKNSSIDLFSTNFLVALLINLLFVVGTLAEVKPFSSFMAMGDKIKDNWARKLGEPPYGHAEESSIKAFCQHIGISFEEAKNIFETNNITIKNQMQTLKSISDENHISPNEIYILIKPQGSKEDTQEKISNLGKKSLKELSDMGKIDLVKSIAFLRSKGLDDVNEESKMKSNAGALDMTPYELFETLVKL